MVSNQKPKLTPKQEVFAQEYIKCLNQSEAYRRAYNTKPDTKPESVWKEASKTMQIPHVSSRVAELHEQVRERTLVTRESLTAELNGAIDMAISQDHVTGLTGAVMAKARVNGLDINKNEISGPEGGEIKVAGLVFNPVSS